MSCGRLWRMPDVRKTRCHAAHSELHAIFVQPLSIRPYSPHASPLGSGVYLALHGGVCAGSSTHGACDCPLQLPATPLPYPLLRAGSWGDVPLLCGLGPVVSWLPEPGPPEKPAGDHVSPGTVSSFQLGLCPGVGG